jgi:cytochrome P450
MEIRLLLDEILSHFTAIEQVGAAEWTRSNRHTGLRRLPLQGHR